MRPAGQQSDSANGTTSSTTRIEGISSPSAPPADIGVPTRTVGREGEIRTIADFLGRIERRSESVLLFSGEAGVGKTRLLREAESRATKIGMTVLSVDCGALDHGVAYGPWVELLRHYLETTPRKQAYSTVQPHLRALSSIAPGLNDLVWLFDPSHRSGTDGRETRVEPIGRFFVAIADERPLLLAIDDLGSADNSSLELLGSVARLGRPFPLGIVGTYRDTQPEENKPLRHLLSNLESQKSCTTVTVRPLDRDHLGVLIGEVLQTKEVPTALRDAVFEKSRGNPYYAAEIAQWLLEAGTLRATSAGRSWDSDSKLELPAPFERAIEVRLGRTPSLNLPVGSIQDRLAILPFANLSPDPGDAYFADGLTEEMIGVVSQVKGFQVIARTSVMPYKSASKGVFQIGLELGVSSILEGSVRRAGDRLRIAVQLIDVRSQAHLWAHTFERALGDVFAVQSEIARKVANALKIKLGPAERSRLESRRSVRPDSYLAYLRGRISLHTHTQASLETAKNEFERSISLDPMNAAAHAGLAAVTEMIAWWFPGPGFKRSTRGSRGLAARALDLDPDLAEAHEAVALVLEAEYDYRGAEKEFKLALELSPSYSIAHHNYASILEEMGRPEEALLQYSLAEGADPLWARNLFWFATLLVWSGRPDEALVKIRALGQLEPDGVDYHAALTTYYLSQSKPQEALDELRKVVELEPEPRRKSVYRARYLALSGRKKEAEAQLRHEESLPVVGVITWAIALTYAEMGNLDDCFRLMEQAADAGYVAFQQPRLNPIYENVRTDPRLQQLLAKLGIP
ncbi:MAG TPA: AAA family ATPase [Thermoplasmata archaeon]|nr:AAA family ATPase [Thermoplasmata archaeon]